MTNTARTGSNAFESDNEIWLSTYCGMISESQREYQGPGTTSFTASISQKTAIQ